MGRSGYTDDLDSKWLNLYRGRVERAIRGKRGQAFLREMAAALDAMPVKELVAEDIVREDVARGETHVCAIGAVALARKLDVKGIDPTDRELIGEVFNIAPCMAAEIAFENDDDFGYGDKTPADRWKRMRRWVDQQLVSTAATESRGEGSNG